MHSRVIFAYERKYFPTYDRENGSKTPNLVEPNILIFFDVVLLSIIVLI